MLEQGLVNEATALAVPGNQTTIGDLPMAHQHRMKMLLSISYAMVAWLLPACVSVSPNAVVASQSSPASDTLQDDQSVDQRRLENHSLLERLGQLEDAFAEQQMDLFEAGGLEMQTATVHVMGPPAQRGAKNTGNHFPSISNHFIRGWGVWMVKTKYDMPYKPEEVAFGLNSDDVWVSFRVLLPSHVFSTSVEADGSGKHSVVANFNSQGIEYLRALRSNRDETGIYHTDWYGVERLPSEPPTPMGMVLVSDDTAYLPFSVEAILSDYDSQGLSSYGLQLATGLSLSEATMLRARL